MGAWNRAFPGHMMLPRASEPTRQLFVLHAQPPTHSHPRIVGLASKLPRLTLVPARLALSLSQPSRPARLTPVPD